MKNRLLVVGLVLLSLGSFAKAEAVAPTTAPAAAVESVFVPTPLVDIAGQREFADVGSISEEVATQLAGTCSLANFRALPEVDRHVYSFDPWPSDKDDLGKKSYTFNFRLGNEGATSQKVAFLPNGSGAGKVKTIYREKDSASGKYHFKGFGNLDWSGNTTHVFKFDKPVMAFGVVLRSTGDIELRRFAWKGAPDNGFPVSYTLADGTTIQLGARELRGALVKADTNAFIGIIDRSGTGIVSVSYSMKGLAGNKAQGLSMCNLAFVTMPRPAVASVINLKSSCDFHAPETIAAEPLPSTGGLATLDTFRFIVGNHRYVYHFDTWPKDAEPGTFAFDLKGHGAVGQKVTLAATVEGKPVKLAKSSLTNDENIAYSVLSTGTLTKGMTEHTFTFDKPVWAFGVTYRSPGEVNVVAPSDDAHPVSYTLSDGTVINIAAPGSSAGHIAANAKTFVGVKDLTDKGIRSVTFRLKGTADASQPLYIEDLAFAMAGPPPGDWKLTMADEFDGTQLDPKHWGTGYRFVDVINNELQAYVPENVVVGNGVCTIKVEHRKATNTDWKGNTKAEQQFASGAFTSADRWTQTYGYFEARLKMPRARGAGVWPAFWVLPDRGPDYPDKFRYGYMSEKYGRGMEIDIFEFMPRWKYPDGTFPIHHGCIWSYGKVTEKDPAPHGYGAYALDNDGWGPKEMRIPDLDSEFHTYGLYWSPERLIWYIDSKPVFRVRDAKKMADVPHYFLFNIALHLNGWGKSPDKSNPTMDDVIDDLPNAMEIDYFRAYSGTLEEALPTPPNDVPGVVTKYTPPSKDDVAATPAATQPAAASGQGAGQSAPAAPVNSGISTPSN